MPDQKRPRAKRRTKTRVVLSELDSHRTIEVFPSDMANPFIVAIDLMPSGDVEVRVVINHNTHLARAVGARYSLPLLPIETAVPGQADHVAVSVLPRRHPQDKLLHYHVWSKAGHAAYWDVNTAKVLGLVTIDPATKIASCMVELCVMRQGLLQEDGA